MMMKPHSWSFLVFQFYVISTILALIYPRSSHVSNGQILLTKHLQRQLSLRDTYLTACTSTLNCTGGLTCTERLLDGSLGECSSSATSCLCLDRTQVCVDSDSCPKFDVCINLRDNAAPSVCVPCESLLLSNVPSALPYIEGSTKACSVPIPSWDEVAQSRGNTDILNSCQFPSSASCRDGVCMTETNLGRPIPCAKGNAGCVCLPVDDECVTSDDCVVSEECIKLYESSQRSYCVPCERSRLHGGQSRDDVIQVNGFASPSVICPGLPPSAPPVVANGNIPGERGIGTFLDGCTDSKQCSSGLACISENNIGLPVACSSDSVLQSSRIVGCVCIWVTSSVGEAFSRVSDDSMNCKTSDSCAVGMRCVKLFQHSQMGYCIPCGIPLLTKRVPTVIVVDGNATSCQNPPPMSRNANDTEGDSHDISDSAALTSCDGSNPNCPDFSMCATITNGGRLMECRKPISDESLTEFYNNKHCFCLNPDKTCRDSLSCNRTIVVANNDTENVTDVGDECYKLDIFSKQGFCIPKHALGNRSPAPVLFTASDKNASDDDIAADPTEQPSPSSGPNPTNETLGSVCIAAHALMNVPRDELIYARNRQATVLCDEMKNCATPGHIVTFEGRAMMMKSYCQLIGKRESGTKVGCEKVDLHVNSVSMKKGRRIDSFHSQLKYTPLAAAHESRFEEIGLALLVYLGF